MSFVAALQPTEIRRIDVFGSERALPIAAIIAAVVTLFGVVAVLAHLPQIAVVLTVLTAIALGMAVTPGTSRPEIEEPDYR